MITGKTYLWKGKYEDFIDLWEMLNILINNLPNSPSTAKVEFRIRWTGSFLGHHGRI